MNNPSTVTIIAQFHTDDRSSSVKPKRTLFFTSFNSGVRGVAARTTMLPIFNECVRRHRAFTAIDNPKIYHIHVCAC